MAMALTYNQILELISFYFLSFPLSLSSSHSRTNSDGGGRSGVYLAIDTNMELAEEEDCFHVFGYLKKLRQSRKGLIENVVSATNLMLMLSVAWRIDTCYKVQFQCTCTVSSS